MMVDASSTEEVIKARSPPARRPPVINGKVILKNVLFRFAPKFKAASSKEVWICWLEA
jgi:hypothetical protein